MQMNYEHEIEGVFHFRMSATRLSASGKIYKHSTFYVNKLQRCVKMTSLLTRKVRDRTNKGKTA